MTWLTGGALAVDLLLVVGLIALVAGRGFGHFWQGPLLQVELEDGSLRMGELRGRESSATGEDRMRLQIGNRELTGLDFVWIAEAQVREISEPRDAVLLERREWGRFYGFAVALHAAGSTVEGRERVWRDLPAARARTAEMQREVTQLRNSRLADVDRRIEALRRERRAYERAGEVEPAALGPELGSLERRSSALAATLRERETALLADRLVLEAVDGARVEIPVAHVVRALRPNAQGLWARTGLYLSRLGEFLWDDPRESNTEGGVFPAIFGTLLMVFITSAAVGPFGVLAAVYLREYAKSGLAVRIVRVAVHSLAGVPSIVFGVFGLGFFVYGVGGALDSLFFEDRLPAPTFGTGGILWASLTLALLTVPVVIVSTEEGLAAVPRLVREGSLALGATRWETLRRVVLPAAAPGVLTGLILAMARAAGEVAPLMIVGMVKLAPSLPVDGHFPFVHLERKFMHLGFHIFDVGFQSPNVEAAQPLVYATSLLLILVVLSTNLAAILLRNRLRAKFAGSGV
ncbi:MAG: phosphate ABC transporter permease PstA [Deltaproteobacteria bacterium]|nr:phosphate ABC transporter permease PstA [Deltaproteobacteria bacterium]